MPTPTVAPASLQQAWGVKPAQAYHGPVNHGTYGVRTQLPAARRDYSSYRGGSSGSWGHRPGASQPARQLVGPANTASQQLPNRVRAMTGSTQKLTPFKGAVSPTKPRLPGGASTAVGLGLTAFGTAQGLAQGQGLFESLGGQLTSAVGSTGGLLTDGLIAGPVDLASFAATGQTASVADPFRANAVEDAWTRLGENWGRRLDALIGSFFPNRTGPDHEYQGTGVPPFQGGQSAGVSYYVYTDYVETSNYHGVGTQKTFRATLPGPITGVDVGDHIRFGSSHTGLIYTYGPNGDQVMGPTGQTGLFGYTFSEATITHVERVDGLPDTGGNPAAPNQTIPKSTPQPHATVPSGVPNQSPTTLDDPDTKEAPEDTGLPVIPFVLAGGAAIPAALLAGGLPQVNLGPGPNASTASAGASGAGGGLPLKPSPPRPANPGKTPGKATPPSMGRTQKNNRCGCNKGLLAGMSNLLKNNPLTAANTALLTKIDATTTATGVGVASNAGVLAQTLNMVTTIQQFSRKTWDFLQIDRFLAVANFTFNLHNAYFLSRSLADTIGWTVDSVLNVLGLGLKDADDNPLSITELVSDWVDTAVDAVIPEETQAEVAETLNKANRIYQAASNIYWQLWSLMDSSQAIAETIGQYVGKIGNALRRSGAVMENSYGWMTERFDTLHTSGRRWEKLQDTLNSAEEAVSAVGLVSGEITTIQQIASELPEQRQALSNAIKASGGTTSESDQSSSPLTESETMVKLDSEASAGLEDETFDPTTAGRPEE
ncbi:hypothetical protein [Leptothoe spongobia]|uniref:Uncharacterized protein n=1 Tax=Leptothoe spongobia TAU-MAC 1115 TaxID=1967444 RepID=A0A947GFJ4_9CYAN|nr:hypothetical protein [Leptothoe spongobia]MBT9314380.1 hypothetical protein [Leptothoe spongobia TAU-MAC 1115]